MLHKQTKSEAIFIRLTRDLKNNLTRLANDNGLDLSPFVRMVLVKYVNSNNSSKKKVLQ